QLRQEVNVFETLLVIRKNIIERAIRIRDFAYRVSDFVKKLFLLLVKPNKLVASGYEALKVIVEFLDFLLSGEPDRRAADLGRAKPLQLSFKSLDFLGDIFDLALNVAKAAETDDLLTS